MTTYFGLNIGPIYATITQVKATRELWAASYIFSSVMEDVANWAEQTPGITLLLPATLKHGESRPIGVGLFPDKLILQAEAGHAPAIQEAIKDALNRLADEVASRTKQKNEDVRNLFAAYFQTYLVQGVYGSPTEAVEKLNKLLDVAELRPPYLLENKPIQQILLKYFNRINGSDLKKKAFQTKEGPLDSIIEIATSELGTTYVPEKTWKTYQSQVEEWRKLTEQEWNLEAQIEAASDKEQEKKLREELKALKAVNKDVLDRIKVQAEIRPFLRNYHKYIAIVTADGDNVGSTLKTLKSAEDLKDFSQKLLSFGKEAAEKISSFGGFPVYLGGDDLLFFAPVMYQDTTVFELLTQLDDLFKHHLHYPGLAKKPSLSFGVSITFHKYPMRDALIAAHDLLDSHAKTFPLGRKPRTEEEKKQVKKNSLAFRLQKHSGQGFGSTLAMQDELFKQFSALMEAQLQGEGSLISSIAYRIGQHETVLDAIGKLPDRLEYFFAENFNEREHQTGDGAEYLKIVQALIHQTYLDADRTYATLNPEANADLPSEGEYARKTVYALLRTIHFLKQSYDE